MSVEVGEYRARALSCELCTTKSDKEQIAILFELYPLDLTSKQVLGTITSWRIFEGNSDETTKTLRERRLQELALIGFSLDTGELVKEPPFVRVTIGEEEDQEGELRKRVEWINALERTLNVKNAMGDGQKLAFLARMKAYAAATGAPTVAGEPATEGKVAEPWDET
jgi:hypothetical protein